MKRALRVKALQAMDFLARCANDEDTVVTWLTCGVADGDGDDIEMLDDDAYVEDENFKEIIGNFLWVMCHSEGLFIDGVCKDREKQSLLDWLKDFIVECLDCGFILQEEAERIRAVWTTYCLKKSLYVDTAQYDNKLQELWAVVSKEQDGIKKELKMWHSFDEFDHYMCAFLV